VEKQRARFVVEAELSDLSHAELCQRHNISRPTSHLWLERYRTEGLDGLKDLSHRPASCAHATSPAVVARVLEIRDKRGWGARKIRKKPVDDPDIEVAPSIDTVNRILVREGRIEPAKPRRRRAHPGPPSPILPEPNGTWTADFKGEFRTQDGKLCFPLTVQAVTPASCSSVAHCSPPMFSRFRHLFRECSLPQRIRTDNGPPFASTAIAGLSQLSVWWISLGITPELIEPGKPQQNGRHERMHRTLKMETALPARADLRAQQSRFSSVESITTSAPTKP
jgi:transposase InsO family protein